VIAASTVITQEAVGVAGLWARVLVPGARSEPPGLQKLAGEIKQSHEM
jgi:hypothetical protein